MGKKTELAKGLVGDAWSKLAHDQADRTGLSAKRVSDSLDKGVHPDVVALQVNKNQEANNPADPLTFTGDEMKVIAKFHMANKRRPAYTGAQAAVLDSNQAALDGAGSAAQDDALPA
ncbi:hypothetical protein [Pseudomonas sp. UBA7530]|uniref:hypothetical protein n=1 Tax=Pseudomonas sp. UBA7530 TaxID=1947341 RepID=UPI0025EAC42D|nr:hypothetical protein [Pseudomonas sp. UBA7530]